MARNKTRRRQLQKAAQRRALERRRQRRQRILAIVVGVTVAAAGGAVAFFALTGGDDAGSPRSGPSPSATAQIPTTVACGADAPAAGEERTVYQSPPRMQIDQDKTYRATVRTSCGAIELDLFAKDAPQTVNNFVFLAREGFYDGTIFHRVIQGFMLQGGDPEGSGFGGPGYQFGDEFVERLTFTEPGLLAMANSGANTNGSQFFITTGTPTHLNGRHTIFGKVRGGMDAVTTIEGLPTDERDKPLEAVYIESVTIEER